MLINFFLSFDLFLIKFEMTQHTSATFIYRLNFKPFDWEIFKFFNMDRQMDVPDNDSRCYINACIITNAPN